MDILAITHRTYFTDVKTTVWALAETWQTVYKNERAEYSQTELEDSVELRRVNRYICSSIKRLYTADIYN